MRALPLRLRALRLYLRLSNYPHELRLGVRTAQIADNHADDERHASEPMPYATLGAIARHIDAQGGPRQMFADIGCGLGRPLYYFASRFEALRGYELEIPVYDAAQAHLTQVQRRHAAYRKIALVEGDATQLVPLDRPLTLLLYNPFGPAALTRLCERLAQARADIRIYYALPAHEDVMVQHFGPPRARLHRLVDIAYFHLPC